MVIENIKRDIYENNQVRSKNIKPKKEAQITSIVVPRNRMSPLKKQWKQIVQLLTGQLHLMVRMNLKTKQIELKPTEKTEAEKGIILAQQFLKAFMAGFKVNDAMVILRVEDTYVDSFNINDVKRLKGAHLSRCIGRIAGQKGKTKFAIENATKTRIVLAG